MATLIRRYVTRIDPKTGKRVRKRVKNWYGQYRDYEGKVHRVPLCPNRNAAQAMLVAIVKADRDRGSGLTTDFHSQIGRPTTAHLIDFEAYLANRGGSEKQVRLKIGRVRRVLQAAGVVTLADLTVSKVQHGLARLKARKSTPALDSDQESFTRAEVAALLRVKLVSVAPLVKRAGLAAHGAGPSRTFPRATVLALLERSASTRGEQTLAYYVREAKSFAKWLMADRRTMDNPLVGLQMPRVTEKRRDRRPLTLEDFSRLLEVTRASERACRGMSGTTRALLYEFAAVTGFRAAELASLTPADIDLESFTVTLAGRNAKNGRTVTQPFPAEVVDRLNDYLTDRPANGPIWPGNWHQRAAAMLRGDLADAAIAATIDGPDGPLHRDFHSFRHLYTWLLNRSGATLKEAMTLARHSDPKLTTAVYGKIQAHDLSRVVDRFPSFAPQAGDRPESARATGTDGRYVSEGTNAGAPRLTPQSVALNVALAFGNSGEFSTATDNSGAEQAPQMTRPQVPTPSTLEADRERLNTSDKITGGRDRTCDTRLMKPKLAISNPPDDNDLDAAPSNACTQCCTRDPDLTRIVDAWPSLPKSIRRAMLALASDHETNEE